MIRKHKQILAFIPKIAAPPPVGSLTISGAGTSAVNGLYLEDGTYGLFGRMSYKKDASNYCWNDGSGNIYYLSAAKGTTTNSYYYDLGTSTPAVTYDTRAGNYVDPKPTGVLN